VCVYVRVCVCVCVCVCLSPSPCLQIFLLSVSSLSLSVSLNTLLPPHFLSHITSQHNTSNHHFYGRLKFKLPEQQRRTRQRRKDLQGTRSLSTPHPLQLLTLCWVNRSLHWTLKYVHRMWQQRILRSITML
jgi:hypothetical protein